MNDALHTSSYEAKRREFAALARTHETALVRASVRLCRGQHDRAQDLVQDTLVRAYQAYLDGRFLHGSNAWPWLLRILTNLFINDLNHRKRWDAAVDLDTLTLSGTAGPAQTHAAPADVPGTDLLARTLDEELERALFLLSDSLRVCVLLTDMEGLSYEETAQVLGIPMAHKIDPTNLKPCWHMQTLVSAWVDGRLTGLAHWYTEKHLKDCPQCQASVPFLKTLHFRLSDLGRKPAQDTLTEQQWQAVEAAWEQTEQKEVPPQGS